MNLRISRNTKEVAIHNIPSHKEHEILWYRTFITYVELYLLCDYRYYIDMWTWAIFFLLYGIDSS